MKVKLDENLPARLVRLLAELGHDADTVPQEGLAGRPDADIWVAAQTAARFLITQDLDFSDIRRFAPGTHQGLLLVRQQEKSNQESSQSLGQSHDHVVACHPTLPKLSPDCRALNLLSKGSPTSRAIRRCGW